MFIFDNLTDGDQSWWLLDSSVNGQKYNYTCVAAITYTQYIYSEHALSLIHNKIAN